MITGLMHSRVNIVFLMMITVRCVFAVDVVVAQYSLLSAGNLTLHCCSANSNFIGTRLMCVAHAIITARQVGVLWLMLRNVINGFLFFTNPWKSKTTGTHLY